MLKTTILTQEDLQDPLSLPAEFILDSFPGIWYITFEKDNSLFISSLNYNDRLNGDWYELPSEPFSYGEFNFVAHWMIPCPADGFPGVWYVTDPDGNVISRSSNYADLQSGLWYRWTTPRPNGETLHWALRFV
jgi:hypothetical protein